MALTSRSSRYRYFLTLSSSIHIIVTIFFVFLVAFALLGVLAFRDWDAAANFAGMDSISAAQGAVFQEFFTAFQGLYVLLCSNENWPTIFYEVPQWVNTSQYLADDSFVEIETTRSAPPQRRSRRGSSGCCEGDRHLLHPAALPLALLHPGDRDRALLRGAQGAPPQLRAAQASRDPRSHVLTPHVPTTGAPPQLLRKRIAERLCLTAAFNMLDADNSESCR